MINRLKAQAGKLIANRTELYTLALITIGIPGVFYVWFGWRAALTVFVFTQVALGIFSLRKDK